MNGARILHPRRRLFGPGVRRANPGGHGIAGTTRTPEKRTALSAAGISPLLFADGQVGPDLDADFGPRNPSRRLRRRPAKPATRCSSR